MSLWGRKTSTFSHKPTLANEQRVGYQSGAVWGQSGSVYRRLLLRWVMWDVKQGLGGTWEVMVDSVYILLSVQEC